MILHEFPDIIWLKRQIEVRFRDRKAFNGLELESEGFPSVVINTKVKESFRPDIKGPISLFMNMEGISRVTAYKRTVVIPERFFFVTNRFDHYTLEIESELPVETLNIHMGEYFSEGILSAMLSPIDTLLHENNHQEWGSVKFSSQLYKRDALLEALINQLKNSGHDKLLFEETLTKIFAHFLEYHHSVMKTIYQLPPVKHSTKVDLYKRLAVVMDYLYSTDEYNMDLSYLASLANLSKYHFLRLFKHAYSLSPHQYIQQLRLEKAAQLLKKKSYAIKEIASLLGFENSNSFSRLFHQHTGRYPQHFQRTIN
jgi:AraC family transcriptional regulator